MVEQQQERPIEVDRFVTWLIDNPGKQKSIEHGNVIGLLWRQTWFFDKDSNKFKMITEAPGLYSDWTDVDGPSAIRQIQESMQIASSAD